MDEQVTPVTGVDDRRAGRSVSTDDDGPVGPRHLVRERERPVTVRDRDGFDAHTILVVNHAALCLGDLWQVCVPICITRLEAIDPSIDIRTVRHDDVVHHRADTRRADDLESVGSIQYPGAQRQVGQAKRVIGVQVGDEHPIETPRAE